MKKLVLVIMFLLLVPAVADAQCAMCRAVLESGEKQEVAEAINDGIVYLMAVPYILMGALGYFIYRKLKG
ncbi:hypothetical protein SAMN04487906_2995 [Zhouia amylolytica]|uniref:Uncharacterized protein n=2 Tax=Zhouia amylolytica TaxID=376730 RepID=W2UM28_9FLAO|nr:hypothetical protein [Zhouia amylolytica]ETN94372.1 hypothetical protein P278_23140 [Zhouia amylolytica AD3]MCQ0110399.1 hypothetical protein [Zhouia amylolytica]SFT11461.1 hypothetical protein SAMN04487906_2995 [Zhouia amylolytica]